RQVTPGEARHHDLVDHRGNGGGTVVGFGQVGEGAHGGIRGAFGEGVRIVPPERADAGAVVLQGEQRGIEHPANLTSSAARWPLRWPATNSLRRWMNASP